MTTKSKKSISFPEAFNQYYKLKTDYELPLKKTASKLANNSLLSITEKQENFSTLKKKCIKCRNLGGTIFSQDGNLLIAKCGNIDNPCSLDIQLQKASYKNILDEINIIQNIVTTNKSDIINLKLNFLYGLIDEKTTTENFANLKTLLIDSVKQYKKLSEIYLKIIGNFSNIPQIKTANETMSLNIQKFKEFIDSFNKTGTTQFIKDAVELYINEISVSGKALLNLKYKVQYIFTENNIHYLIQRPYTTSQLETVVPGTEDKIIAFNI